MNCFLLTKLTTGYVLTYIWFLKAVLSPGPDLDFPVTISFQYAMNLRMEFLNTSICIVSIIKKKPTHANIQAQIRELLSLSMSSQMKLGTPC